MVGSIRLWRRLVSTVLVVMLLFPTLAGTAHAEEPAVDDPGQAQELAERYAPVMLLKSQEQPCDTQGEQYGPTSVDIVLDNPEVVLRQLGPGEPVILRAPGASDLFGLGEGVFLDFPGSALEPGCLYETDFDRFGDGLPAVVYAHIARQDDRPELLALQYWTYWYYNDWNNKHESDWEFIQLLFEASSIEEALATSPISVGYAQHEGGEQADWDSSKLERDGTHPIVYSSAGSHASYFGSALYLGRSGSEGFGCDNTDGPSDRFDPEVVVLPDRVDDPTDELAWLQFGGRWGERQSGPFNGPTGPLAKPRWHEPVDWHEALRSTSVVIPAGDADGLGVVTAFCEVVEWGAGQLILVTTSPWRLGFSALLAFLGARWLVRRTDWSRVELLPVRRRRSAGQIIRAATTGYRRFPVDLLTFGLVYIPTAVVVGFIGALVALIPLMRDVLDLAKGSEGANLVLAAFAGSLASLGAYVAVNAMVATHLDGLGSDSPRSAMESAKYTWSRRRDLTAGFVRAYVVVFVLMLSIVGLPWGIRQLVRYQFLPQTVMVEGLSGKDGLERSSQLVRGRWLHTGVMIAVFNSLLVVASTSIGLVVLVLVTNVPLWFITTITTLIYALVTPLTATAQVLLYGDALEAEIDIEPSEAVLVVGAVEK